MPVKNITEKSNAESGRSIESMPYGPEGTRNIPKPSNEYPGNDGVVGKSTQGRNQSVLNTIFPLTALGLDTYNPAETYALLMSGDKELALGAKPILGAEAYVGENYGTSHHTYDQAPNMPDVPTDDLNLPNPYVPDVSIGAAKAKDYK